MEKTAQQNARTIIPKHSRKNAQKAIAKFQKLITTKPKQGNKAIFKKSDNPPLDSLLDSNNNIITHPTDIADEIFIQQSATNAPTMKTCIHQPQHHATCAPVKSYNTPSMILMDSFSKTEVTLIPQYHHYSPTIFMIYVLNTSLKTKFHVHIKYPTQY